MKNAFIVEAGTVNAGTKLITRGTAQQQVGEHIEKRCVELRQKRGGDAHPERRGIGVPPVRGSEVTIW